MRQIGTKSLANQWLARVGVDEHKLKLGFGDKLVAYKGPASAVSGSGTNFEHLGLENQLVSRDDGAANLDSVHGEQDGQLAGVLQPLTEEYSGYLGQGLDYQDAGHDGSSGEVPLEELLVEGYVLYAYNPTFVIDFDYAVDHEERIAVGQDAEQVLDIEGRLGQGFFGRGRSAELADQLVGQGVPGAVSDDTCL